MIPERATSVDPETPEFPKIPEPPKFGQNSRVRVFDFGTPKKGGSTALRVNSRVKTAQNSKILHALYS